MRDARTVLRRVDVRMGLAVGAAISLLLIATVTVLFFVATHEAAEAIDDELRSELRRVAAEFERAGDGEQIPQSLTEGRALRIVDASGATQGVAGSWPATGRLFPHRTSSLLLSFASPEDHLVRGVAMAGGRRLEGAVSLSSFVGGSREHLGQIAVSLAVGLVGAIAITVFATRRALAPLREATRAVERIDERTLDARLPLRGCGDDVDRHAIALNRVLERLEESFQRISAFSADVAHELRTPVNRALNLAEAALLAQGAAVAPEEFVAIRESMEEMRRLIERLLLLSRGDAGRIPLHRERVDLADLGTDLVELFRPTCEQNRVALEIDSHGEAATAWVDPGLIQQAVANLLDNAVSHTPGGGAIRVDVAADGDTASIAVSDAGAGVPEQDRERIFDRFVQLDGSRSAPGAGLGLAIARMIARLHGGELSAGASPLGGACFELRIPRAGHGAAPPISAATSAAPALRRRDAAPRPRGSPA